MTFQNASCEWQKSLPNVTGDISFNAPLAAKTWFAVGGPAEVLFVPSDLQDLQTFLQGLDQAVPVMVIGAASNLLVRDGGILGVVIMLGKTFEEINVTGHQITAGGAAPDVKVASAAARESLTGLEFLRGVPGTVGGAIAMNAGAFGGQISDVLVEAQLVSRDGEIRNCAASDLAFRYRSSALTKGEIVVAATFQVADGDGAEIRRRMQEIARERSESQPVNTRTGGSTFKNPPAVANDGLRAWQLIDQAGCRGLEFGGARVSEKHCNFIENTGSASAADIEMLIDAVRARVQLETGVSLEPEIKCVGERMT